MSGSSSTRGSEGCGHEESESVRPDNANEVIGGPRLVVAHGIGRFVSESESEFFSAVIHKNDVKMMGTKQYAWAREFAMEILIPSASLRALKDETEDTTAIAMNFDVDLTLLGQKIIMEGLG